MRQKMLNSHSRALLTTVRGCRPMRKIREDLHNPRLKRQTAICDEAENDREGCGNFSQRGHIEVGFLRHRSRVLSRFGRSQRGNSLHGTTHPDTEHTTGRGPSLNSLSQSGECVVERLSQVSHHPGGERTRSVTPVITEPSAATDAPGTTRAVASGGLGSSGEATIL